MIARLFAYGTLQPGRLRWPFLAPYVAGHRPAHVRGRIYDSGLGWPVMVFDDTAGPVAGTIVDLDRRRLEEILLLLDDVERAALICCGGSSSRPPWAHGLGIPLHDFASRDDADQPLDGLGGA